MSQAKQLVLQAKAFVKMIHWMSEFANFDVIPQGSWVEAMGIMFCKETSEKYIIADAEGITSGNLVYVETSPQQVADIVRLEEKLKQDDQSIYAGGWFHSHPGHSLFYSGTDIGNQAYWQNSNPNGVGLVFDLTQVSASFPGFKFFRLDAKESQGYHEVEYELYGFTEDTLLEAFKPLMTPNGLDIRTIHRLALHLGLKAKEGIVEFDKIEVPKTDDPVGSAKQAIENAEKAYLRGSVNKALEQYRIANLLLKHLNDVDYFELYVRTTLKLSKLCVLNDFPETAQALLREIILFTKKMKLKPGEYLGKSEILLGYLSELNYNTEEALEHYKKSIELFTTDNFYEGMYKANDLAGGISWKINKRADALKYFKDALYNLMMAEKVSKEKRTPIIWDLVKNGISAKIKSAEAYSEEAGIEKV